MPHMAHLPGDPACGSRWREWPGCWRLHCDWLLSDRVARLLWTLHPHPVISLVHRAGIVLARSLIYAAIPHPVEHSRLFHPRHRAPCKGAESVHAFFQILSPAI